jgi:hypothetical protein
MQPAHVTQVTELLDDEIGGTLNEDSNRQEVLSPQDAFPNPLRRDGARALGSRADGNGKTFEMES